MSLIDVFKLDSDGDIDISSGRFTIEEDTEAIKLMIIARLKLWIGEWFLNLDSGIDYIGEVFHKNDVDAAMNAEFLDGIIGTQGVTEVSQLDIDIASRNNDNNNLKVDFTAKTIFTEEVTGSI